MTPGLLVFSDGAAFPGFAAGAATPATGPVAVSGLAGGYNELLTDPAGRGTLLCLGYPHAGNYGVMPDDFESPKPQPFALITREISRVASHARAQGTLGDFLRRAKLPALDGVDTRAVAAHVVAKGVLNAALGFGDNLDAEQLRLRAAAAPAWGETAWVTGAVVAGGGAPAAWTEAHPDADLAAPLFGDRPDAKGAAVTVYDFGAKRSLLRLLVSLGCRVTVAAHDAPAADVLKTKPAGVVLSGGPGSPAAHPALVETARSLAGRVPLWGVGFGAGLLAAAAGAEIGVLGFGHHGGEAVRRLADGHCHQTAQNRRFSVARVGDGGAWEVTHENVNDGEVEGLRLKDAKGAPAWGHLFHPEGAPGARDGWRYVAEFVKVVAGA